MDGVRRIECTVYTDELAAGGIKANPDRDEVVHFIHSLLDAIESAYPQAHVMVTEMQQGRRTARARPPVRVDCDGDGGTVCQRIQELVDAEARRYFGPRAGGRQVA